MNKAIGTKVYVLHKDYVNKKKNGARIIPCRITTYERRNEKIHPVLKEIGGQRTFNGSAAIKVFYDLEKALKAL